MTRALMAAGAHLRVFALAVLFGLSVYAALIVLDWVFRMIGLKDA